MNFQFAGLYSTAAIVVRYQWAVHLIIWASKHCYSILILQLHVSGTLYITLAVSGVVGKHKQLLAHNKHEVTQIAQLYVVGGILLNGLSWWECDTWGSSHPHLSQPPMHVQCISDSNKWLDGISSLIGQDGELCGTWLYFTTSKNIFGNVSQTPCFLSVTWEVVGIRSMV